MSRKHWTAGVVGIVSVIVLAGLPLAALAAQDTTPAWTGTYGGFAKGSSAGDTGETQCTIWVEAVDAATARVSIQVPGLPVLSSTGRVTVDDKGDVSVPLDFGGAGVNVGANVKLVQGGGGWMITGEGAGQAFGLTGTGNVAAQRSHRWIAIPSFADQLRGTVNALLGRPDSPAGFPEKNAQEPPPSSPVQLSEPRPPLSLGDMLAIDMGFDVIFLIIGIV
jgi:hypothetical protein